MSGEIEVIPAGAPMGRPSKCTPAIVGELCERLSNGEPLTKICRDEHMPSFSTVWRWEREDADFKELSARAKENGTHYLAHEAIEIADAPGDPQNKRVRIDTRLRLIGKWNSKAYGDKVQVESKNLTATVPNMPDDPAEAARVYERMVKGE